MEFQNKYKSFSIVKWNIVLEGTTKKFLKFNVMLYCVLLKTLINFLGNIFWWWEPGALCGLWTHSLLKHEMIRRSRESTEYGNQKNTSKFNRTPRTTRTVLKNVCKLIILHIRRRQICIRGVVSEYDGVKLRIWG